VRRRDLGAAAVLLVFGLVAVSQARGLKLGSVAAPGPGFFPLGLAIAFSLVSLGLLVSAFRTPPGTLPPRADAGGHLKVLGALGALLIYALTLEWLGFPLATFGLLLFFFKVLQRQRWLVAVAGSLATSLTTYLIFKLWLGVNLPAGPWRL
jgi:putative tricarboxylic transport membrane protein